MSLNINELGIEIQPSVLDNYTFSELDADFLFINTFSLPLVESFIKDCLENKKQVLPICLGFYKIYKEKLYKQKGYKNYFTYLKESGLIHRSKAYEYFYIGKYWVELKEDLKKISFTEKDGICKLKIFPKKYNPERKKELFEHLKNDSCRDFKVFVKQLSFERKEKQLLNTNKKNIFVKSFLTEFFKQKAKSIDTYTIEEFLTFLKVKGIILETDYSLLKEELRLSIL
jgi:hypothetical protein